MTPLRQRMLDAMVLRGMALRTQEAYIDCVGRLARHYECSPDKLSAEQVQQYLLHLLRERQRSTATVIQYGCACRFFYGTVLGLDGAQFHIPVLAAPQRLPQILARQELAQLFAAAQHARARAFLMLAYGTGLRLSELCQLRVTDIDSHADRMCIRVVQGKGGKDRYVPLDEQVLQVLRAWWHHAHPREWLFTTPFTAPPKGQQQSTSGAGPRCAGPISHASPQKWYHAARTAAGITKQGGIHTLRHCYATHLLENGADLFSLSQWLGHRHVSTTARYLHLTRPDAPDGARLKPLSLLGALPLVPGPGPKQ
jgi:integrase/recombinase XerD